jgi:UDP-glucose 4-epimerase
MILIIGGAGYIGSHMVMALQDPAHKVLVFDNLSRSFADAVGTAPLVVGDLRNQEDLNAFFVTHRISLVMHFAALAYVGESVSAPELYYQNNVVCALNLLATMRHQRVDKLVFSSTCAIYGEPDTVPISESHPQRPINPLGRTKLMMEQALFDYATAYGMQSINLRYFNAAGADALRLQNGSTSADTALLVFW